MAFREHSGNTNGSLYEGRLGWASGAPKSRMPLLRTLEPRMVFDAAAVAVVEHANQAAAHHESSGDGKHQPAASFSWPHLADVPKASPVTLIDKSPETEPPPPVQPERADRAIGDIASNRIPFAMQEEKTKAQDVPVHVAPIGSRAFAVPDPVAGDLHSVDTRITTTTADMGDDTKATPKEMFFVWDNVKNWQQITAELGDKAEVHVLDSTRDGVEQIAGIMKSESDVDAIHLISHGAEGSLDLGTAVLDVDAMEGLYGDELRTIGRALTKDGDILIYGCDFASGHDGERAASVLSTITQADVAASIDPTGAVSLGGDWDLELRTGRIETAVLVDGGYDALLVAPAIDLDGPLGSTSDFATNYTENGTPVAIVADGLAGATVADSDGDLQSITITASAVPNGNAEHLSFGVLSIGLGSDSSNTATFGATTYGIAYTAASQTFVITNNGGGFIPSGGDTNLLVRSITYDNGSDDPTSGGTITDRVFTFTATDATLVTSAAQTATTTITAVNDGPGGVADSNTIAEDTVATGNVLTNDTDADGDTLSVTQFEVDGTGYAAGQTATLAGVGTLVIDANGSYAFTPLANYDGPVPAATYTLSDGTQSSTATLALTINPVNDAPTDGDETNTVAEDATLTVGDGAAGDLLNNATDIDGGALTVGSFSVAGQGGPFLIGSAYTIAGVGAVTINADGSYVFAPAANFVGTVPVITYTVSDGAGGTDTSILTLTIVPSNDAPQGTDNTVTVVEDTSYTFAAASFGFTDLDDSPANALQAVIITTLPSAADGTLLLSGLAVSAGQTIAVGDIANLVFQPAADANGTGVGSFTFQVVDDGGTANGGQNTDQAPNTFAFDITAVNDVPIATDDLATTPEDTTLDVPAGSGALSNDTDVDGDTLTITQFTVSGITASAGQTGNTPGVGQLTVNADGSYRFIPVANFTGPLPVITYTVSDGHGGTDTGTLSIEVTPVNDLPVDGDEANTVTEDTTLSVGDGGAGDLLNNASDLDGDPLTITGFAIAREGGPFVVGAGYLIAGVGTVTINATGSYSFVPVANYDGAIPLITYTVSDGAGGTDTSTLTLTMAPVNDAPVAQDDAATTPEDTPVSGNVLGNDTDVDDPILTVTFFEVGGQTYGAGTTVTITGVGTLVVNTDGSYVFTPAPSYSGPVPDVTYTVSDGEATDIAVLRLTIAPLNDAPVADDESNTTTEDTTLSVPAGSGLLVGDVDLDGDPLAITEFEIGGTTYAAGTTATIGGVGAITIEADGSYVFVPAPNYNGPVPVVTYTVSDGNGGTDQGELILVVTPVNDAPTAVNDVATTPEDTVLNGSVLANDTDVEGDQLTVLGFGVAGIPGGFTAGSTATVPGVGAVTINSDGTYTLVPAANYSGPVPDITFVVSDGNGGFVTETLVLDVTPINDPPVASNDTGTTTQDTDLNGNVLGNDTDVDGDTLTVTGFEIGGTSYAPGDTANISGVGDLTLNADGSYTFVPEPGYTGPVPDVTYTVSDGTASDDGTLTITVIPPNAVGANGDVATIPEDTTLAGNVLSNDLDPNGQPLSVVNFTVAGDASVHTAGSAATISGIGVLTINSDGSYTFVPAANYFGPVPVATYTATNGTLSDTATLTITVTPVNDPPVAFDDAGTTLEDTSLSGTVLANDTDIDGDALSVTGFVVASINLASGQTADIPSVGRLTINANGSYTFVPAADYDGPVPVATYTVSDGNGGTDTGTLTIDITPVNDAPVAANDTGTMPEDTTLIVPAPGLLANDTDVDGDTFSITGFTIAGVPGSFTAGSIATIAGFGDLTINADGSYVFVPALNFNGAVPVVTYTISDGNVTDTATLALTVTPVNDAPVAFDDTATVAEDTVLTVSAASGLFLNDTDIDGGTLSVTQFEIGGVIFGPGTTATFAGVGSLTINADGSYAFTPVLNYNGPVPPVTYTVSDGNGGTDTAILTITVTPVNDAPVADDNNGTTPEDTTLTGQVLGNDTDIDGDTLSVTQFTVAGDATVHAAGTTATIVGVGDLTINADGSYTFVPATDYNGPVPVATYTASDGNGGTDTATLTLNVTPVNDPPALVNDIGTTPEDTTLTVSAALGLLSNDSDAEGDALTIQGFSVAGIPGGFLAGATATIPGIGTLTINANGSYVFTPVANYNGPGPVATYRVTDGALTSNAVLTITVTPVDDPPVDGNETNSVTEDTTLTVPAASGLLANTTDIDGAAPSVSDFAVAGQAGPFVVGTGYLIAGVGTITINADGSYSFTPSANYAGAIPVLTYTVSDGAGGTDTSTLTLTMVPVNDPPVDGNEVGSVTEDTVLTVSAASGLLANATDLDGGPLSISAFSVTGEVGPFTIGSGYAIAGVGTLTVNADGSYVFAPVANYTGAIPVVTYTVSDGAGGTDTSTLTLTMVPVNDPPVDGNETNSVTEDTMLIVASGSGLLANTTDIDGGAPSVFAFVVAGEAGPFVIGTGYLIAGVGTVTVNANGSYSFAPASNYVGSIPVITYIVSDGAGGTDTSTLTLGMVAINDAPAASDDTGTTPEDTALNGNVLTNDTDVEGDTLSVTQFTIAGSATIHFAGDTVSIAGIGDLTIDADGSYTFVPSPNYFGPVPVVTYTATDGLLTDAGTLTLNVTPVNDPPVDGDEARAVTEDRPLVVLAGSGLLANTSDIDGGVPFVSGFSVAGETGPFTVGVGYLITGVGTITINPSGSYAFAPAADYTGAIPVISYTVSDGAGGADASTLTLTMVPVNDPPVDGDESNSVTEDSTLAVPAGSGLLANTTDVDGGTPSITGFMVAGEAGPFTIGSGYLIAGVGTVSINADGSYSFAPAADYAGTIPLISYTVSDGNGGTDMSILALTMVPVNDPPVASDDSGTTPEDVALNGTVLTNDTDIDGGVLRITQFTIDGTTYAAGRTATITGIGAFTINPDGSYAFVPAVNYNGPVPAATYTVSDGEGGSDTAILTIVVTPVNDAPDPDEGDGIDTDGNGDGDGDGTDMPNRTSIDATAVSPVDVSNYFLDVDGDLLTYSASGLPPGLSIDPVTGVIDGTPPSDASRASPYLVTVTATDPSGVSATQTFEWSITNPVPIAGNDAATVAEDAVLTGRVIDNDSDPDGDPLTVTQFTIGGTTYTAGQTARLADIGSLTIAADGTYTFMPAPNYNGSVPVATYTLRDADGDADTATLALVVTPVNDPPEIVDDQGSGNEDTPITGNVLGNDSDPDNDPLVVTGFSIDGDPTTYLPGETASIPGVGTIKMDTNGDFVFGPAPNYDGPVPDVVYSASDGNGGSGEATLALTITPIDDFVPMPDDDLPEMPGGIDYHFASIEAAGAVLDAVDDLSGLNRISDFAKHSPDAAIRPLLTTFLGGSSAIVIAEAGGEERIRIETIKHTGVIYLQIVEEEGDESSVFAYRLRGADGAEAPAWLRQIGPLTFAGYPDAGAGTVDLVLTIVQRDGRVSDHVLRLDSFSGNLTVLPAPEERAFNGRAAPMFSEQLNERSRNHDALERALGFR